MRGTQLPSSSSGMSMKSALPAKALKSAIRISSGPHSSPFSTRPSAISTSTISLIGRVPNRSRHAAGSVRQYAPGVDQRLALHFAARLEDAADRDPRRDLAHEPPPGAEDEGHAET